MVFSRTIVDNFINSGLNLWVFGRLTILVLSAAAFNPAQSSYNRFLGTSCSLISLLEIFPVWDRTRLCDSILHRWQPCDEDFIMVSFQIFNQIDVHSPATLRITTSLSYILIYTLIHSPSPWNTDIHFRIYQNGTFSLTIIHSNILRMIHYYTLPHTLPYTEAYTAIYYDNITRFHALPYIYF